MEKQPHADTEGVTYAQSDRGRQARRSKWLILAALFLNTTWVLWPRHGSWFPFDSKTPSRDRSTEAFSWDRLPTKPYLEYQDCYKDEGEYQCARLELPVDYWNGTTDATISLAVIRKPAVVPVTHPKYGGAILGNPGGPGGSGLTFLLDAGDELREVVDSDDGKYFDLISFDPRGIGQSTPRIQCFEDRFRDQLWTLRTAEQGVFSASDAALGRLWSMTLARGQSCSLPLADGELDIKKYVSTSSAARDMLEIVERHGEWREKEAKRVLEEESPCNGFTIGSPDVPEALKYEAGKEKINYWGFSYGSYLGNTFAAMFPDRINRLIVDGVVDAYDYKKSLWFDNLVDTEKDLDLFYYHCARVGFPTCVLANETGKSTPEAVKQRMRNIIDSLYHDPLPIISSEGPDVVTYTDMKLPVILTLYAPLQVSPLLASWLVEIEQGNGLGLAQLLGRLKSVDCPPKKGPAEAFSIDANDPLMVIACGDGDDQSWMTKAQFEEHLKNVTKLSPSIGEVWSQLRMTCIHYNVRPYHRFHGPWVGNTSHPILEIGNSADPVTPGRYAKKMAKGFTDAVALIQDSAGHCSLSSPSMCTEKYVKQYFQTGELPPDGTVCDVDALPFGPTPGGDEVLDVEVQMRAERQARIANAMYAAGGGFLNTGYAHWMSDFL